MLILAYVGTNADQNQGVSVAATGTALLSGTATLNTSLTLAAGSTLDMVDMNLGAVTLNGALTLGGPVIMGDNLLSFTSLLDITNNHITLFTGLTDINIQAGAAELTVDSMMLASNVFSNLENSNLYIAYQVSTGNVGSLTMVYIPEPTTSTLSLLALSALVARRRRR